MDVLTDYLRTVGASARIEGVTTFPHEWCPFAVPNGHGRFLSVIEGTVRWDCPPDGTFDSPPGTSLLALNREGVRLRAVGETSGARAVTGLFTFATGTTGDSGIGLPSLLRLDADVAPVPRRQLLDEVSAGRPGWEVIASGLAMVLLVEALRIAGVAMSESPDRHGWLRGMADPEVGQAIQLMHEQPAHPWTVGELADRLSVSRSTFAARFKTVTGRPPLTYLTWWRLCRAAARLRRRDGSSIGQVARDAGYDTEAAFGKAFRRQFGQTPGQVRREGVGRSATSPLQSELNKRHPFAVPEQETSLNLARTNAVIGGEFEELFERHGLTGSQFNFLRILRGHDSRLRLEEIAARLVIPHRAPAILDKSLVEKTLVDTIGDDLFTITARGRAILADLDEPVLSLHRRQLAHLTPGELEELDRLLVKARRPS